MTRCLLELLGLDVDLANLWMAIHEVIVYWLRRVLPKTARSRLFNGELVGG